MRPTVLEARYVENTERASLFAHETLRTGAHSAIQGRCVPRDPRARPADERLRIGVERIEHMDFIRFDCAMARFHKSGPPPPE
jgi:hypothetical protein